MRIVLIGFACCYKSSVGKPLAERLGYKHIDVDRAIEQTVGKSVAEIFEEDGESAFREWENNALLSFADCDDTVISCGGGSALLPNFPRLARDATVVWLTARADTVVSRLGMVKRPLFDGRTVKDVNAVMLARKPFYERYADVTVATDGLTSQQVTDVIIAYKNHLTTSKYN